MADAKGNFDWQQTSTMESLMINMNRASNSKTVHPDELNPYAAKRFKKKNTITGKAAWDMFKQVVLNTMNQK